MDFAFLRTSSSCHESIAVVYEFGFPSPLAVMPLKTDENLRSTFSFYVQIKRL